MWFSDELYSVSIENNLILQNTSFVVISTIKNTKYHDFQILKFLLGAKVQNLHRMGANLHICTLFALSYGAKNFFCTFAHFLHCHTVQTVQINVQRVPRPC
jgi:hypothetical protein